jgi:hypothetical protein
MTVADILEQGRDSTTKEWLTWVKLVAKLTNIPLSDANPTSHLPKIIADEADRQLTETHA